MDWMPISEVSLWDLINAAEMRMDVPQSRLWEAIRIQPVKWTEPSYGDVGGGFWAVAVIGNHVVWYNDIEDGFNRSRYTSYGTIAEYLCNQDQLEWTLQGIVNMVETGKDLAVRVGPPKPGFFAPEV